MNSEGTEKTQANIEGAELRREELCEPVHYTDAEKKESPAIGTALCLSGGGYRATLFHTGVIWRLNDMGLLSKLDRISSVSGGSITAGLLALNWKELDFEGGSAANFRSVVVEPLQSLCSRTIDRPAIFKGALWFGSIGDRLADSYRKHLFGDATLQDITDSPRFVINATSLQSGVLWRFSKPYMRDYRVGEVKDPATPLAIAVAASSAFPPVLSPVTLSLSPSDFTPDSGTDLQGKEFRERIVLTDGGVYDNLGLETAWKRYTNILVSDAGGGYAADANPHGDWLRHTLRVLFTIDNQVRSLRTRQVIESFESGVRRGAYWSISGDRAKDYPAESDLVCEVGRTTELARLKTRLKAIDRATQERVINWGYAACDSAVRSYFDPSLPRAAEFPFAEAAV